MNEFGASPPLSPGVSEVNTFNDGDILTPAAAVVSDPFDKLTHSNLATPVVEKRNPMENMRGIMAN